MSELWPNQKSPNQSAPARILNNLIFSVFPKTCLNCRIPGNFYLCPKCRINLELQGKQLFTPKFKNRKIYIDVLISPLSYQHKTVKDLVHLLKYNSTKDLKDELVFLVIKSLRPITKNLIRKNIDAVTPIPLHPKKEKIRGFNQSDLIARDLARYLKIPYQKNLLTRIVHTQAQASLQKKQRLHNVKAVFRKNKTFEIKGLDFLLIDDVATTLSTMNEAAKTLKSAGAKKVWGLTVAR